MWYLIGEIVFYLGLATVLGFVIGWQLNGYYKLRKIAYLEKLWKANLFSRETELQALRERVALLENQLSEANEKVEG